MICERFVSSFCVLFGRLGFEVLRFEVSMARVSDGALDLSVGF